jgi:type II secretory pathway component PulF
MLEAANQLLAKLLPARDPYPGLAKAKRYFRKTRAKFYSDFADAIDDGANPFELFSRRYARAKARRNPMAPLYAIWRDRASSKNLRKSWEGTIPNEDLIVISAGEKGNLAEALRFLSRVVTLQEQTRAAITGAVVLPIFMSVLLAVIQLGVAYGMMPIMTEIMPPEQFPLVGAGLYAMSGFVANWWPFIYGIPILLVVAVMLSLSRWAGPLRRRVDNFGPYAVYRDVRAGEFLVALAALTGAKTSVFDSISLLLPGASPWLRSHLLRMRASLKSESSMVKAMDTGLFNEEIFDRLVEYSGRTNFDAGIRKIGLMTVEEVAESIKARSVTLRSVLLALVGLTIIFTVGGMLQIGHAAGEYAQSSMF